MTPIVVRRRVGKSLFAVFSLIIAGVVPVVGQQFSLNAVGYADVSFVAGSNLIANPFNAANNTISNLFRTVPNGTVIVPWNRASASFGPANTYNSATGWSDPNATLTQPGGAFLHLPSAATISFAGEVTWPTAGCYTAPLQEVTSVIPEICGIGGTTPPNGVELCLWNRDLQDWECYYYFDAFGDWVNEEFDLVTPELGLGEAALSTVTQSYNARFRPGTGGTPAMPFQLVRPQRSGTNITFQFAAAGNVGYTLQLTTNLTTKTWTAVEDKIAAPSGGFVTITAPMATNAPVRFYKLASVASPNVLINASRTGTQFRFQFYGTAGTNYTVQRSASLSSPSWNNLTTVSGTGGLITVTDLSATAATAYYRLTF